MLADIASLSKTLKIDDAQIEQMAVDGTAAIDAAIDLEDQQDEIATTVQSFTENGADRGIEFDLNNTDELLRAIGAFSEASAPEAGVASREKPRPASIDDDNDEIENNRLLTALSQATVAAEQPIVAGRAVQEQAGSKRLAMAATTAGASRVYRGGDDGLDFFQ